MGRAPQRVRQARATRGTGKYFGDTGLKKNAEKDEGAYDNEGESDYVQSEMRALFSDIFFGTVLDTDNPSEVADELDDIDPNAATNLITMVELKWNPKAKTKVYPVGEGVRTLQRRTESLKARAKSVADQPRLRDFGFVPVVPPAPAAPAVPAVPAAVPVEGPDFYVDIGEEAGNEVADENEPVIVETEANMNAAIAEIDKTVKFIDCKRHEKKQLEVIKYKYNQLLALRAYFSLRVGEEPMLKMDASRAVATVMFPKSSRSIFSYKARCIRQWASQYLLTGDIVKIKQGCHPKTHSIIFDEGAKNTMKDHLRYQSALLRTPQSFMNDLNETVLRTIPNAPNKVGLQTARRWLFHLGFAPVRHGKGYYVEGHERDDVEGHERDDVVEYRTAYLARMLEVERKVGYWEGDEIIS